MSAKRLLGIVVYLRQVFSTMTALRDLYLEKNQLEYLPSSITKLSTLVMLRLSANRLRVLPNVCPDSETHVHTRTHILSLSLTHTHTHTRMYTCTQTHTDTHAYTHMRKVEAARE